MTYYNTETSKGIDCSQGTPHENDNFFKLNDSRTVAAKVMLLSHDYFNYIENNIKDKFIGWPILRKLVDIAFQIFLKRKTHQEQH